MIFRENLRRGNYKTTSCFPLRPPTYIIKQTGPIR